MDYRPLRPTRIEEISPTEIAIDWDDGHRTIHRYRALRLACQCAQCRDELTGAPLLRPEQVAQDIHPLKITPVGTYALRFYWSDGHDVGLYPFAALRRMCECPVCEAPRR